MEFTNEAEIEKRISEMEQKDYEFVKRMNAKDYLLVLVVCILCFAAIIGGAFIS